MQLQQQQSTEVSCTVDQHVRVQSVAGLGYQRVLLLGDTSKGRAICLGNYPAGLAVPAALNAAAAAGLAAAVAPSGVPASFLRLLSGTRSPPGGGCDALAGTGGPCGEKMWTINSSSSSTLSHL